MQKTIKYFLCILLFTSFNGPALAQYTAHASVQVSTFPKLKVNSGVYENSTAQGIQLLAKSPMAELGLHLFRGYDSAIDFSYGVSVGLTFAELQNHQFKGGLQFDRFYIDDYKMNTDEVGGIIEDDLTDAFGTYLKWEWNFSKLFSLYTEAGYRVMRSDRERVTNVIYDTNAVTGEKTLTNYQSEHSQRYYGSGFEFGIGIMVLIY